MTTGQRISEKRKELGLSQEALGEKLGVSRQSIYKWESDASLPDIDKLVALSRLFGVPVGWLLGVEEVPSPAPAAEEPQEDWTQRQEHLVEEVLLRYQQSQPSPQKSAREKWSVRILFLMCAVLLVSMYTINAKVERMDSRYNGLQISINNVSSAVNSQIGSITGRVEEILKSQNELTADYGTALLAGDLARNAVTFSARAVPKTYVEGMEVAFLIDSGDGPAEFPAEANPGREFTAELTCELTDSITISAVFINGDTRQTQVLDTYDGLYSGSLPEVYLHGFETAYTHEDIQPDGTFHFFEVYGWMGGAETETKFGPVELKECKVGLFRNHELVAWLTPCEKPDNYHIDDSRVYQFYHMPAMALVLEEGDVLHFAAFLTDEHGRQAVCPSLPPFIREGDSITWPNGSSYADYNDIAKYDLTPK